MLHLKEYFSFLGDGGCDPTLSIYLPENACATEMGRKNTKRPCMIVCPGGGYGMCSQRESEPIAMHFLPEGFNVFLLRYSVAPHRFPTQLREVAAVMELIYKNADEWNCDTEKVAIIGFSAGGHLAAHYSTAFDCEGVREVFPESKSVNASVLCYPVISADPKCGHLGSFYNLLGVNEITEEIIEILKKDELIPSLDGEVLGMIYDLSYEMQKNLNMKSAMYCLDVLYELTDDEKYLREKEYLE